MTEHIEITETDYILTIRIKRPERKNAFTADMYGAMADALARADEDPAIRVVVFLGSEGCFTAGNDLNDFLNNPPADENTSVFRFLSQLAKARVPLVAAVDGHAVGVGTTMLLHCDFVLVTETANLLMPFVNLGIVPEAGSSLLLPRLLGHPRAAELILLAEPINGAKAVELGLANKLCNVDQLESEAMEIAQRLAAKPPSALQAAKSLLRDYQQDDLEERIRTEMYGVAERLNMPEAKEAITAMLEKRKPDFSNLD